MRTCETQLSHDMYRSRETNLERARNDAVHDSRESTCSGRMSFETDSGLFDSTDPKLKPSGKEIKITSERTCFNAKVLPWNVLAACLIEICHPPRHRENCFPFDILLEQAVIAEINKGYKLSYPSLSVFRLNKLESLMLYKWMSTNKHFLIKSRLGSSRQTTKVTLKFGPSPSGSMQTHLLINEVI